MNHHNQNNIETEPFDELADSIEVGVAIYGQSGRYIYVNQSYAELFDVTPSELNTKSLWEVVTEIGADDFDEYWISFEDGETRKTETIHKYNNQEVPVASTTTQRSINDTVYHFETVTDISESKHEAQVSNGQGQLLGNFAGVVCHDLRNPLSVAQGYIDVLQDDIDRGELQLADDALNRMSVLITEFLRLAQDSEINEMSSVSLETAVEHAWKNVEAKRAVLRTPETDAQIVANESYLQQLLENLLRNAIKHEGPEVDVSIDTTEDGFYVADDGSGISPNKHNRIFETGYTVEEDGTGFGLSIVQQIVTIHDWDIGVTKSSDDGARFDITNVEFDE
ncbi:PAS domain-containing sensor histidine kinase [Haloquadratum walsbyi]|jgi:PAS domain S-box|uniref:histidine kinase n=1 Tax=Haloquadratum walsbyi J07HQW2 TaxID=1238425 RepID=U1MWX2_9EURY|nr:PAS domain-containing sensor histidine kinase [Haloquadratum walsbyi]ERG94934.1 MAG: PAS sensor histidine kinase [Haloquadratum walsbyi J07HQW2]